jgi:hypothetical protein
VLRERPLLHDQVFGEVEHRVEDIVGVARCGCRRRGPVAHSVHQLGAPLVSLLPQVLDVLLGAAGEFGELLPGTGHGLRLLELGWCGLA